MSGPVWRRSEGETVACEQCLGEVETALVVGKVVDGEFAPQRRLCERCYREAIALLDRAL